ncbi:hypothetical protein J8273_0271 [Carpediemonas membranifera]|uniref:Uncharacterized protein n=1 Tax=Carpediemonas membranifera TaxID=201153 RepID=A0A8J6B8Q0_9EUKA|nr:hypothetical protein J8273_0271 [Carpediemonas membranifera]|eukprot:KAG9395057.1 hypothetical protein J8273_0271 [Carpediemonas membranifera]
MLRSRYSAKGHSCRPSGCTDHLWKQDITADGDIELHVVPITQSSARVVHPLFRLRTRAPSNEQSSLLTDVFFEFNTAGFIFSSHTSVWAVVVPAAQALRSQTLALTERLPDGVSILHTQYSGAADTEARMVPGSFTIFTPPPPVLRHGSFNPHRLPHGLRPLVQEGPPPGPLLRVSRGDHTLVMASPEARLAVTVPRPSIGVLQTALYEHRAVEQTEGDPTVHTALSWALRMGIPGVLAAAAEDEALDGAMVLDWVRMALNQLSFSDTTDAAALVAAEDACLVLLGVVSTLDTHRTATQLSAAVVGELLDDIQRAVCVLRVRLAVAVAPLPRPDEETAHSRRTKIEAASARRQALFPPAAGTTAPTLDVLAAHLLPGQHYPIPWEDLGDRIRAADGVDVEDVWLGAALLLLATHLDSGAAPPALLAELTGRGIHPHAATVAQALLDLDRGAEPSETALLLAPAVVVEAVVQRLLDLGRPQVAALVAARHDRPELLFEAICQQGDLAAILMASRALPVDRAIATRVTVQVAVQRGQLVDVAKAACTGDERAAVLSAAAEAGEAIEHALPPAAETPAPRQPEPSPSPIMPFPRTAAIPVPRSTVLGTPQAWPTPGAFAARTPATGLTFGTPMLSDASMLSYGSAGTPLSMAPAATISMGRRVTFDGDVPTNVRQTKRPKAYRGTPLPAGFRLAGTPAGRGVRFAVVTPAVTPTPKKPLPKTPLAGRFRLSDDSTPGPSAMPAPAPAGPAVRFADATPQLDRATKRYKGTPLPRNVRFGMTMD